MTNYIFNKKGNFIVGLLLNAVLLINYIVSEVLCIKLIRMDNENSMNKDYSNQNKILFIVGAICIICIIFSFVVLLVKKRQSGLGVSLIYIMELITYIANVITGISINGVDNWILLFLNLIFYIIIPILTIIFIAIYFSVPKKALQIISVILVIIPILYSIGHSIYNLLSYSNVNEMSTLLNFTVLNIIVSNLPKIPVIIQLIISFRFKKMDNSYYMYSLNQQQLQEKKATDNADELYKYKELLDCGTITQKEFDDKKKELLNL